MIYLDNSAATQPHKEVLETFVKASEQYYGNPASLHKIGNDAENLLESARKQITQILNMDHAVFTSGGTESNNLAILGTAAAYAHRGRHIISSNIEHASVLKPLEELEKRGFEITRLTVNKSGHINLDELKNALRNDTILVTLMHINNEIGVINPIADIKKLLKGTRTFLHTDAVQSVGKVPLDKEDMPDLLSFSAHKLHGLKGSGILAFNDVQPAAILYGGGQEFGYRSGTVPVPHAAAAAKALRIAQPNPQFMDWNKSLREFFSSFDDIMVISPENAAPHILSIAMKGVKGEILVSGLQDESIIVSTSSACSSKNKRTSHVIEALDIPPAYRDGVIRISFGAFTDQQDISDFQQAFKKVHRIIKGV
ncbi:cysteine desulfurase [Planomicrobium okeanokoites]|uniref:cysteine desulfurase family protein n=1 Tax=Planomicrobium okeanokoites TaxID=244 RepID=UPI000E3BE871|nr:cysteine desulfurase family protein [Planomicrobium okeanokoites]TAA70780.1 cysteine desulfurase [Planomicrobium okeanokoites]